jgi:hypothetical protein
MLIKFSEHMKPIQALEGVHKGIVVSNEDPQKLGRVKCTIKGVLEGDTEKLPWISSKLVSPKRFNVPEVGETLIIEFVDSIYNPYYTGYWHDQSNHNTYFDTNYPKTFGIDDGIKLKYNKETKEGKIEHESGSNALLKQDGTLEISLAKDMKLTISGKYEVSTTGDIKFTPTGKFEVTATDEVKISSSAKVTLEGTAGTDVGKSSSVTNVKGSLVNLAGGGFSVALVGSQAFGLVPPGIPVFSTIIDGSSKVYAVK